MIFNRIIFTVSKRLINQMSIRTCNNIMSSSPQVEKYKYIIEKPPQQQTVLQIFYQKSNTNLYFIPGIGYLK